MDRLAVNPKLETLDAASSPLLAAAFLVFLPATAWARVVSVGGLVGLDWFYRRGKRVFVFSGKLLLVVLLALLAVVKAIPCPISISRHGEGPSAFSCRGGDHAAIATVLLAPPCGSLCSVARVQERVYRRGTPFRVTSRFQAWQLLFELPSLNA